MGSPVRSPVRSPVSSQRRRRLRNLVLLLAVCIVLIIAQQRGADRAGNHTVVRLTPNSGGLRCECQHRIQRKLASPTVTVDGGGFHMAGSVIWGGSVVRGPIGDYHIFASRWDESLGHGAWVTSSEVVHGVSSSPLGPFQFCGVALPRRGPSHWDGMATHNPTVHWDPVRGEYALFYIGVTYSFQPPATGVKFENRTQYEIAWNTKRVGVALSASLDGPWRRLDAPIIQPRPRQWDGGITSNPAACIHSDGSVLLFYKSIVIGYPERNTAKAQVYIHTYIHTYVHTYIHTYMHTYNPYTHDLSMTNRAHGKRVDTS